MVDFGEPHLISEQLSKWMDFIATLITELQLDLQTLDKLRNDLELSIKGYTENPEDIIELDTVKSMPLREGLLKNNFGVPIVIVGHKSDFIEANEKAKGWE